MPRASYTQTNFLGGFWSPQAQGRTDNPKYIAAMNECLNIIPLEAGAAVRRPGTNFGGTTFNGADGRLIDFDFQEPYPYKLELTGSHMRVWFGNGLVFTDAYQVTNISTADPAVITVVPGNSWNLGDEVQFLFNGTLPTNCPTLFRRSFLIAPVVGTTTQFTLTDPITGVPVNGASLGWQATPGVIQAARVLNIVTPWGSTNWAKDLTRLIQAETQGLLCRADTAPQLVQATPTPSAPQFAPFTLTPADFLDGPYLDPVLGLLGTPSGSAVVGPVVLSPWNATTTYTLGNAVSLSGLSGGNAPQGGNVIGAICVVASSTGVAPNDGDVPDWAYIIPPGFGVPNINVPPPSGVWDSSYNYTWGQQVTYATTVGTVTTTTIYTSIAPQFGNIGNEPDISPSFWEPYNSATADSSGSGLGPGSIQFDIAYQPWSGTVSYNLNDYVTSGGQLYRSTVDGNFDNTPGSSVAWVTASGVPGINGGAGFLSTDVGRHIRLHSEPLAWVSTQAYAVGAAVQYPFGVGSYYSCITANTGVEPDQGVDINTDTTYWLPSTTVQQWAWGKITAVNSPTEVIVSLVGFDANAPLQGATDTLLYTSTIFTWQLGVYSNSGPVWPATGVFHEGRMWLGGAVDNRFDASASNGIYWENGPQINMAPTGPDGTVSDANGISETLRSSGLNQIQWMRSYQSGILMGTLEGEWLVQASTLSDPLTPSSIQAHEVTKYGSANIEPVHTGVATVFIQKFGRRLMEFLTDVFTGRYSAPNLSQWSKTLLASGAAEIRYQEELAPIVWTRNNDGSLVGCTYRRLSSFISEEATFYAWHRHLLGSTRVTQSICSGPNQGGTLDAISMVTNQPTPGLIDTNVRHVEVLTDIYEEYNTITQAWFLDDAVAPIMLIETNGVTCYGLWHLNGKTVTAWIGGLDCGDFAVSNGQIFVPWGSAGPLPAKAGLFTLAYLQSLANAPINTAGTGILIGETISPPVQNTQPATVQWYPGNTLSNAGGGAPSNGSCLPDWVNKVVYFLINEGGGGIVKYSLTTGQVVEYASNASIFGSGAYSGYQINEEAGLALTADGNIQALSGNGGLQEHATTINPNTLGLISVGAAGPLTNNPVGLVALASQSQVAAPVVLESGLYYVGPNSAVSGLFGTANYVIAAASSGFTDGQLALFNLSTQAWSAKYTTTGIYYPQICSFNGQAWMVGDVRQWNTTASTVGIFSVMAGPNNAIEVVQRSSFTASSFGANWKSIVTGVPVVDQDDGNLIVNGTVTDNAGSQAFIAKVNPFTGQVLWSTGLPAGDSSLGQNTWNNSRVSGGVLSLNVNNILCVVNLTTGALVQYTGYAFGNEGGGQAQDSVSGQIICFADFQSGTATHPIVGINGTPPAFNYEWATCKLGTTFQAPVLSTTTQNLPAVVGFTMTSTGQILRPGRPQDAGTANGPPLGKERRTQKIVALLENTQGISFGTDDLTNMRLAELRYKNETLYAPNVLYSDVLRTNLDATSNYDNMLAWQITRPYPATVCSIGGFLETQDQ